MLKSFILCFLFITIASIASAGEGNVVVANIDKNYSPQAIPAAVIPEVNEKYEYYDIQGGCQKDLQCQMRQKGVTLMNGKKYDSSTSWHVKWDYGYNRSAMTCSPDSFRVVVEIVFRYPKWVPTDDAPRPLVDKWDGFMQRLVTHENGHRDLAVEAAADLARIVANLPPASTCDDLDHQVQALSKARMSKLDADQKVYDAVTNHGYTQGAVF